MHYNTTPEKMLSLPIDDVEDKLVDYLLYMKKQDLSTSFINLNFCALKHFYFMNNVRINKEKIGKFLGESKKKNVDRSYTHAEIKSVLDIADLRFKVVISVLASTGIRIGSRIRSGVRQINHLNTNGRQRQPIPLAHGYRKFFTTQLINAKVNPEIREMLLGHSIGLAGAYYKPTENDMLEEYMKGVDNVTINPENKLKRKVEMLTIEKSKVDQALFDIQDMKARLGLT